MIGRIGWSAFRVGGGIRGSRGWRLGRVCAELGYRLVMLALVVYLLPALLAVLIISGLGMLILAVASLFGGSTRDRRCG